MTGRSSVWLVYVIALVLSACSLLYELLIAQTLTLLAGNMVVWYSLTVGTYLCAMGVGAVLYDWRPPANGWSTLYGAEVLLSVVGAGSVILLHLAHSLHLHLSVSEPNRVTTVAFFLLSFAIIFTIGILTGLELPILMQLGNEVAAGRRVTNRVLGWDYIGALVGGLIFPLLLVPYFELLTIGFVTAAVNLSVALFVLFRFLRNDRRIVLRAVGAALFGGVLILGLATGGAIQQYFLKSYYYYVKAARNGSAPLGPKNDMPDVFRTMSPYQKIDIVQDPDGHALDQLIDAYSTKFLEDPSKQKHHFLFLNGDLQVASDYEELYHEWFAHVPILVNGKVPRRVLVLGAGDGLLHRELIKYDGIERIVHVDLDPEMISLARSNPLLRTLNEGSLEDPRIETLLGDAFQYVRRSDETFDAIYLDFPYVMDYNLSKLYSREFYHFVRERLADDGFVVLDAPRASFPTQEGDRGERPGRRPTDDWEIYYHTLRMAGFETVQPFFTNLEIDNPKAYDILEHSDLNETVERHYGRSIGTEEARAGWMRQFVEAQVRRLKQGFIFIRKGSALDAHGYEDPGIKLHILNRRRFRMALPSRFPLPAEIDQSKVNSILRPTMPTAPAWSIRQPW